MMDADDKSKTQITKYEETRGYTDPSMQEPIWAWSQTQAMQAAGANANGAVNGFAGIGMMGGMGNMGANVSGLIRQGAAQQAQDSRQRSDRLLPRQTYQAAGAAPAGSWTCSCGCRSIRENSAQTAETEAGRTGCLPEVRLCISRSLNPPKFCPNCETQSNKKHFKSGFRTQDVFLGGPVLSFSRRGYAGYIKSSRKRHGYLNCRMNCTKITAGCIFFSQAVLTITTLAAYRICRDRVGKDES